MSSGSKDLSKPRLCQATLLAFLALFFLGSFLFQGTSAANVVRPAPDFTWLDQSGRPVNFAKLRGQSAVILIAPTPRTWAFRRQVGQIHKVYERLAANRVLCFAAFTQEAGRIRSNIPFVIAADGGQIASLLGVDRGFAIAIIGRDGNLDLITSRVTAGQRVLDVINNSFSVQEALRRP